MMKNIFIFAHFGLNIHHSFTYFVTLKGIVCIIGKLFWLHWSDKIVKPTWQRIVMKLWYDIFAISPTPNLKFDKNVPCWKKKFLTHPMLVCWSPSLVSWFTSCTLQCTLNGIYTFASNWNHGGISCDVHFAGHLRSNRTNIWSDKSNIRNVQSGGREDWNWEPLV